ncbi:hypothetical protein RBU49_02965 [Clostridium sp. MB40-C1]|uniref:hypothetical protein n=1 Tax=Clostridium sp. MB40-C1 TaxID=3070996 RepID=UPI0027DF1A9C|nr:hypothetical protein [Clostridium sp. MB40-C1]WMJ81231.1 hypothetical protein RBU49_02965 [Clostridium sp. MB40-C1]
MADDRRVNMYFSERKIIDDTIYQYFKDIPNKQDIMKMVLYEYVTSKHENNTNNTQKSEGMVTETTPKKHKNVTKKTLELHNNVTEDTQVSEEIVTNITQEEHQKETKYSQSSDINFDDFITEKEVENKDTNESEFNLMDILESQNRFMNN